MRYFVFSLGLMVCGCKGDNFVTPPLPDNLKKEPPYDFAEARYPRDLSAVAGGDGDMAAPAHDLMIVKDLVFNEPRDMQ
jgi:hypothetical protein